jgi:hypothetical protein
MESRFSKYENTNQAATSQIKNINSFVNYLFGPGNDIIEDEIKDLKSRIAAGNAPKMFHKKVDLLIDLGKQIEKVHEAYHFNKNDNDIN